MDKYFELKNNEFLMPSGPQKARVSEALPKFQCLLFGHSRDFFLGQVWTQAPPGRDKEIVITN